MLKVIFIPLAPVVLLAGLMGSPPEANAGGLFGKHRLLRLPNAVQEGRTHCPVIPITQPFCKSTDEKHCRPARPIAEAIEATSPLIRVE
jgi:hypothetical protein